ncbi:MAG: hypothetical protein ACOYOQ_14185 [Microthrixaceae bacterium]
MGRTTPGRFFRTVVPWFVGVVFWGFVGVLGLGAALNGDVPPAGRMAGALLACGCAGVLVVTWRAGVGADADGVVVRRYRGTSTRVAWSQVTGFEVVANGSPWNSGAFIAVVLDDGRRLTTQGLVAPSSTSPRALELVAELEACRPDGSGPRRESSAIRGESGSDGDGG